MTKLPEPVTLHSVSLDRYGMAPFDVKGYTKAQMLQFRRDALDEAVQAGFVLVPAEPTAEMLDAYACEPYSEHSVEEECRSAWRAMLAAAPKDTP